MHGLFGLADVSSLLAVVGLICVNVRVLLAVVGHVDVSILLAVVGLVCAQGANTLSTCDMIDGMAQGQCLSS